MRTTILSNLTLILFILLLGCKSDVNSIFTGQPDLAQADASYLENPSAATGNELIKKLMEVIKSGNLNDETTNKYLNYGLKIATEQKIPSRAAGFLYPIIKQDPNSPDAAGKILELAGLMKKMKKESAANTLYKGLQENFADFSSKNNVAKLMSVQIDSIDSYIRLLGEQLFEDADNTGINRKAAMSYVDACEAYALVYPASKATPDNLFKAAEVAKSIRTFPKSLALYDWILDKYPNFEKAPTALFLKGFIIENNLGDDEKAKELYNSFLAKYPQHDLADDVQFLIENLGKTDEEILQMIEEKRKQNQQK